MKGLTQALRGISGNYEINRLIGAFGGVAYVVGAHGFVIVELAMGRGFDLATYCLTFPTGLAAVVGGTAAAVAHKDRSVATAQRTASNTALNEAAAEGPTP